MLPQSFLSLTPFRSCIGPSLCTMCQAQHWPSLPRRTARPCKARQDPLRELGRWGQECNLEAGRPYRRRLIIIRRPTASQRAIAARNRPGSGHPAGPDRCSDHLRPASGFLANLWSSQWASRGEESPAYVDGSTFLTTPLTAFTSLRLQWLEPWGAEPIPGHAQLSPVLYVQRARGHKRVQPSERFPNH